MTKSVGARSLSAAQSNFGVFPPFSLLNLFPFGPPESFQRVDDQQLMLLSEAISRTALIQKAITLPLANRDKLFGATMARDSVAAVGLCLPFYRLRLIAALWEFMNNSLCPFTSYRKLSVPFIERTRGPLAVLSPPCL